MLENVRDTFKKYFILSRTNKFRFLFFVHSLKNYYRSFLLLTKDKMTKKKEEINFSGRNLTLDLLSCAAQIRNNF